MSIISDIIRLNVELEGALRVAETRPSNEAIEAAKEKFAAISVLFARLTPDEAPEQPQQEISTESEPENITESTATTEPICEPTVANPTTATKPQSAPNISDLRKAFTLNDKFLFRRELFNGNDQDFNDTISLIASMSSLAEVQEYLFDDLQLDRDNDTVNEFVGIITNHFVNH